MLQKKRREGTIEDRVKQVVVDTLKFKPKEVGQITPTANFANDLGADSLDLQEIRINFEAEFDIEIPDGDEEYINTHAKAVVYIEKKISAN